MLELNKNNYKKILPLVEKYCHDAREIMPVIAGHNNGRVFVDNVKEPTFALIWTNWEMYFLLGETGDKNLLQEIREMIKEEIMPFAQKEDHDDCCFMTYPAALWQDVQPFVKDLYPQKHLRNQYTLNQEKFRQFLVKEIDSKYEISKIDLDLLQNQPDSELAIAINSQWPKKEDFIEKGLGYCCLLENKIIGACFSALVYYKNQSIEIFVEDEFQRKGIAQALAFAFITECLQKGFEPTWEAQTSNPASTNLAEKLGFELAEQISIYAIFLTEEYRLVWNAYFHKNNKEFEKAAFFFEKAYDYERKLKIKN